jgi:hypothetical protein
VNVALEVFEDTDTATTLGIDGTDASAAIYSVPEARD